MVFLVQELYQNPERILNIFNNHKVHKNCFCIDCRSNLKFIFCKWNFSVCINTFTLTLWSLMSFPTQTIPWFPDYPSAAIVTAKHFLAPVISVQSLSIVIHFNRVYNTMKHFQGTNNQSSGDTSPVSKLCLIYGCSFTIFIHRTTVLTFILLSNHSM